MQLQSVSQEAIAVTAGSRLHFGMFSFGKLAVRQFGGVGAMIETPRVRVRLSRWEGSGAPHRDANCSGEQDASLQQRALAVAHRVMQSWDKAGKLNCRIEVLDGPLQHSGLGSGTQLALAVACGLHALLGRECPDAVKLAELAGRGHRSAIGLHGFQHGGLLMEAGKAHPDEISPLAARVAMPPAWRWILIRPPGPSGLSGPEEQAAFDQLPPVPKDISQRLQHEANDVLLPAAAQADFSAFSRSLYRFGELAGRCFQSQQGGIYASEEARLMVEELRRMGIEGVGQSSWGPTLFALAPDERSAASLKEALQRTHGELEIDITGSLNTGATVIRSQDL